MSDHIVLPAPLKGDLPGVLYRPARYFRKGRRGQAGTKRFQVVWAIAHSAECGETDGAAEGLLSFGETMPDIVLKDGTKRPRYASWTYACDRNSTTQSVLEADTAFHAPPLNDMSIGVELAGRASQTTSDWEDEYSKAMLDEQAAPLFAGICHRYSIPVQTLTDDELREALDVVNLLATPGATPTMSWEACRARYGGILTHAQVSRTFKKSDHTDPGFGFPMTYFLEQVEACLATLG
jgi:hypothetical protein